MICARHVVLDGSQLCLNGTDVGTGGAACGTGVRTGSIRTTAATISTTAARAADASLDPASTSEPATVDYVINAAVGLAHVVRDCILELLNECFVTHPLRMADGQHVPGPPGDAQHITRRALKHFSDLCGRQSHVTRQDDGNSLVVGEGPEVRDDWLRCRNGRDAIDQLNPLPVFPGQLH